MSANDGRRGQALTELAIVLPVMLLLLLGALDLGRLYYSQITVASAAKEAALVAASGAGTFVANADCNATSNTVMCAATSEAAGGFVAITKDHVVDVTSCPSNASFGATAAVTVQAPFKFISLFGAAGPTLSATATAQCAVLPVAALTIPSSGNCTIPDLTGGTVNKSQAAGLWSGAGFTGGVTPIGDATDWRIVAQTPVSGASAACTSGVTIRQNAVALCTVPQFFNDKANNAGEQAAVSLKWTTAGFTAANLTYSGTGNRVTDQSLPASSSAACTSPIELTR